MRDRKSEPTLGQWLTWIAAGVAIGTGLIAVGYFILVAIALMSWGNNK